MLFLSQRMVRALSVLLVFVCSSLIANAQSFVTRWQSRAAAAQAEQPRWLTPLVTSTPLLIQQVRADFIHQYTTTGKAQWNYDNGKGLELITSQHVELGLNLPPFINHHNGAKDGFGDLGFLMKYRFFSLNEQHGDAAITAFLTGSIPTGKNANGSCCAIVTPTLAVGKGHGQWAVISTAAGTLPVSNAKSLGRTVVWNTALQYHLGLNGIARFLWPEVESNTTFFLGGVNDGKTALYATPSILFGRFPITHRADGTPGRVHLQVGIGQQIALTHFNTYNHATVLSVRLPF